MNKDKMEITSQEIISSLINICYDLVVRFSESASQEEKALILGLVNVIIRLLEM